MPTETVTTNERVLPEDLAATVRSRDEALRKLALRHLDDVRKVKVYALTYLVGMIVLTPVWIVTQYETADGWPKHLSTRSRYAGDWDPWIIWVALIGGFLVALAALRAYRSRAQTEADIQRETEHLESKR
jgi:TRAP-type C4-dicarboxylate transport system permease small subunit